MMSRETKNNVIATPDAWRAASQAGRLERAERLCLPSGATILAARPEPLEWILAGRLPQRLLGAALENGSSPAAEGEREITREEILDLARFAAQLVVATVIEPRIGAGPGEIALEEIPVEDRAFIFEWACRALSDSSDGSAAGTSNPNQEDHTIPANGIERFRSK
jgi:hypothetical protein